MNPDRDDPRALFAALNDGTISAADHARLEQLLTQSAEARALWFLHCDIETGLADWAAVRHADCAENIVSFSPPAPQPARTIWQWLAPLAAAAAIALGAVWWMRGNHTPRTVDTAAIETRANGIAVLSRAVGVEWADGVVRTAGAVLEPGTLRLKSGAALVEFFSGARVVVEGPAELRLVSAGEAFLQSGKINAHVPPQARGFTVGSPDVKVVDFGTDFGFTVGDAAPEVHVFTGKVEVASAVLAPRSLHEGEAVRLDHGTLEPIPAARSGFLAEEELARRDSEFSRRRLAAWHESHRTLSTDPATLVHYTFAESESPERRVTNQAANASPETHGSIVASVRTEGRWPGKGALQFRSEGDRVRLTASTLAEPMHAVTLLAWVRVDSLPRRQNVLLAADSETTGALHWHLTGDGRLRLEIARDLGRTHADWEAVNSEPFVTPERFGQWLMLATTFDGKTIRHYANGQPIGSGASFTPPALHIGTAELGNWNGNTRRNAAAAMDEFAILSRVLSAEELSALFGFGRQ